LVLARFFESRRRYFGRRAMTGRAFGIEKGGVAFTRFMRVVTGQATDARVFRVVALAVGQAVRLEAHIQRAANPQDGDLLPGAMTGAAEIREIICGKFLRV